MNVETVSKPSCIVGRVLSGLVVLFLAMDAVMKLAKPAPVVEASAKLGIGEGTITGLGVLLLLCTALYAYRPTAVLGAVLLTGYLGGAVATHVLTHGPLFPLLFPVAIGGLAWSGLFVRDARVRALVPLPALRRERRTMGAESSRAA